MISQLNSSESEEKYKELAEVYINILQKYTKEIRDIELENEEGELETVVVKSEDLLAYVIQHISLQTLSKLIVEYLSSLNPTESEKKS